MGKHELDETGTVKLNARTAALLWAILLSTLGGAGFVVRMDAKVGHLQEAASEQGKILHEHIASDGHPVALERTKGALQRIDKLESRVELKRP